jgi:hypothetical protein
MLSIRQSKTFVWILVVALLGAVALALGQSAHDARMNQIQVLGSHNSYHAGIDPALFTYLRQKYGQRMDGLEYSHLPIERQLDLGLRSLEILSIYRLRLR